MREELPDFKSAFNFLLKSCVEETGGWTAKEILAWHGFKPTIDAHYSILIESMLREGEDWTELLTTGNVFIRRALIFTWLEKQRYLSQENQYLIASNDKLIHFPTPSAAKEHGELFVVALVDWLEAEKFTTGVEVAGYSCYHDSSLKKMTFIPTKGNGIESLSPFDLPLKFQRHLGVMDDDLPEWQQNWLAEFKALDDPTENRSSGIIQPDPEIDDEIPF